jgi:hypothetical protein
MTSTEHFFTVHRLWLVDFAMVVPVVEVYTAVLADR